MKARTIVGRGEEGLLSDPGYELRLRGGIEKEKCEENQRGGQVLTNLNKLEVINHQIFYRCAKRRPPLTGYSIYRIIDKRMHFLPQLSDSVPLRNGFYSFRAQTD